MNNDNKTVDQSPVSASVSNNVVVPQGSLNKEQASRGQDLSEFVRQSGPEVGPNLPQGVSESGVEVRSDRPDLTFEHKELGVRHAGPDVAVPSSPSDTVRLPMSEEEITDKLKTGQDDDSGKWLAGLIQKIIKAIGL